MTLSEATTLVADAIRAIVPDADLVHLDAETPLRDAFELDSLDFLRFVETLSASAGTPIPEVDYPRLRTMDSCTHYLVGS